MDAPPPGNGAAPSQEATEESPDTQSTTREKATSTPDAVEKTPKPEAAAEDPLAKAILAKGAQHSGGLVGGIGIKAADPKLLRKELRRKDGEKKVRDAVAKCVDEAMTKAGITYGIKDDELKAAIDDFLDVVANRKGDVVTRKVAEGEAADPGEDGWIEYPLNHRGRPFHELAGLDRKSTRKKCRVVRAGEILATLHELKKPKSGTNVKGEAIKPVSEPQSASLTTVAGDNTAISGSDLAATCDGLCEEDARGTLRVIPEIVVDNIDSATGRIPESGLSKANVGVRGDIRGEYGVATTETLFVGEGERISTVDGTAQVQARNLFVNGTIAGGGRVGEHSRQRGGDLRRGRGDEPGRQRRPHLRGP